MTAGVLRRVQLTFGKSEFRKAVALHGAQVIVTPAGTGMLPPRVRRRGGSQSPAPMQTRLTAYTRQNGRHKLTPRQVRQVNRMRRKADELPW